MVDHLGDHVALDELERGASGLFLNLRRADVVDADLLAHVLDGVFLDLAPVILDAGDRWRDGAEAIVALWERLGLDPAVVTGNLGADPLGCWASNRSLDVDADLADAAAWAARMRSDHPGMRTYVVNGTRFANAGASDALELGFSVAYAVATLRSLTDDEGFDAADAFAPARVPLRGDGRPVRHDREVSCRPADLGSRRRDRRRAGRRRPIDDPRAVGVGDDDPLRPAP